MKQIKEKKAEEVLKLINLEKVLKLVKKYTFLSTSQIQQEGIKLGLWKNWNTYKKYLDILLEENKIECFKKSGIIHGNLILWRGK
jgi:hypothetical protein